MKKKMQLPDIFVIMLIIIILSAALTWVIPAGLYDRLAYNEKTQVFDVIKTDGSTTSVPATQETLKKLNILIELKNFTNGSIQKPIAIPNTYKQVKPSPQGLEEIILSPIQGCVESVDIMLFLFMIGGILGLLNKSGAFGAGINALSKKMKGKEFLLVATIFLLITLGGTTAGLSEETLGFYPLLIPLILMSGYDSLICISTIFIGSSLGTMISTVNPFDTVIASKAAGISFTKGLFPRIALLIVASIVTLIFLYRYCNKIKKDPSKSLVAESMPAVKKKFLASDIVHDNEIPFTFKRKLILTIFFMSFVIMIYGVLNFEWDFTKMSSLFLVSSILIMFLTGLSQKENIDTFIIGTTDLMSPALLVGLARSANMLMENGNISDTILFNLSNMISGMNGVLFSSMMMFVYSILGFFIQSSSGLAVLSMPIMAPLADTVHLGREIIVTSYSLGQGLMSFISPTGLLFITLDIVKVPFTKWFKFIWPYFLILTALNLIALALMVII